MENLIETKIDIIELIHNLKKVNEDTKNSLKYYVSKKQEGQQCGDKLFGMALALRNERLINDEEYINLVAFARK